MGDQGRPSLEPDEAERVRAELRAWKSEGVSFIKIGKALGTSGTAVSLWLKKSGPNGMSERTARKIAEVRLLDEDFWRNRPSSDGVTKHATEAERVRWVAFHLGLTETFLAKLWRRSAVRGRTGAPGEDEMNGLPDYVRDAALATVHLEDVTVEQALRAGFKAWQEVGEKPGVMSANWLQPIRDRLVGSKRESGSRPRIRLEAQKKK